MSNPKFNDVKRQILGQCRYLGGKPAPLLREFERGLTIEHPGLGPVKASILLGRAALDWGQCFCFLLIGGSETCIDAEGFAVEERYASEDYSYAAAFLSALQQEGTLEAGIKACQDQWEFEQQFC